ncbi:unnamed protein product [Urochloa decumbens]|uniref:Uncharacterized protein n=1 Tax=Urochloa decumbens TaxID=240449 RepID=A0ABC9F0Z3_9POAL
MALRSLVGKLRGPPAAVTASRAFSKTRECCGKTRIAGSLGQKNGAIKDDLSDLDSPAWKHYMIRGVAIVTHGCLTWIAVSSGVAYLENDENFRRKK